MERAGRDDFTVVIADGVELVDTCIGRVVHVVFVLVAGQETPAAVRHIFVGCLAIHIAHFTSVHEYPVGSDASVSLVPVRQQRIDFIFFQVEILF